MVVDVIWSKLLAFSIHPRRIVCSLHWPQTDLYSGWTLHHTLEAIMFSAYGSLLEFLKLPQLNSQLLTLCFNFPCKIWWFRTSLYLSRLLLLLNLQHLGFKDQCISCMYLAFSTVYVQVISLFSPHYISSRLISRYYSVCISASAIYTNW